MLPRLAAVIGAEGAIGGFTLLAEWRAPGVEPPKDRDFALGLGPVVVTPDEPGSARAPVTRSPSSTGPPRSRSRRPGPCSIRATSSPARLPIRSKASKPARASRSRSTGSASSSNGSPAEHGARARLGRHGHRGRHAPRCHRSSSATSTSTARWRSEIGRRLTLQEVIAVEIATIAAPLEEVVAFLVENVRSAPASPRSSRAHDPLVVSMGFHELIEPRAGAGGSRLASSRTGSIRGPTVARHLPARRRPAPSAASRASAPTSRDSTASSTSATASPTAASRRRRRGSSPATASRRTSTRKGVAFELFDDFYDVASALDGGAVVPPTRSRGRKT